MIGLIYYYWSKLIGVVSFSYAIFLFSSSDNAAGNNTDPLNISSQTPPSDEGGNSVTTKRSFAESNENSDEPNVGNVGATPSGDDEFRRKKRKDETGKEGKSTTQRNTGKNIILELVICLAVEILNRIFFSDIMKLQILQQC